MDDEIYGSGAKIKVGAWIGCISALKERRE